MLHANTPVNEPPEPQTSLGAQTSWPLLTINILSFNRRAEVRQTLGELQNIDYPRESLEIIVVDNASVDGTKEMIEREFPDVKVVRIYPNCGIAGWNAGFQAGRGEYFLVLDDDSAPTSGLQDAIQHLQQNPQIGILACKITGGWATDEKLPDGADRMGFIGCGALIRREVVQKIGGFAPWLYLYAHEWEYGVRVLEAGFEIRYFKECVVHHRGSLSMRSFRKICIYTTRNNLLIIHKYFARERFVLMARTVFHLTNWGRVEFGPERGRALFYVLRGLGMFLREKSKHSQTFVKPEVQNKYVRLFALTQPLWVLPVNFVWRRLTGSNKIHPAE